MSMSLSRCGWNGNGVYSWLGAGLDWTGLDWILDIEKLLGGLEEYCLDIQSVYLGGWREKAWGGEWGRVCMGIGRCIKSC